MIRLWSLMLAFASILSTCIRPISRFSRRLLATGVVISLLAAPVHAAEVTLKIHHFLPKQSPAQQNFMIPWKKAVEEQSHGRIEVQIYSAMELGGRAPDLIKQVEDGVVDLVWTLPGYTPGRFPAISAFELPFMVTNAAETSQAVQEYYETNQVAQDEFSSVHPLIFWTHDRGVLHTTHQVVRTLEDLHGLKIRAPSRRVADALSAYGANPVLMPVPQMPAALKTNEIDGTVIPWEVVPALHVEQLAENSTEFPGERGIYASVFVFAMNKARYNALPDDLKKIIDNNSGMSWAKKLGELWTLQEEPGRNLAKKRGNTIVNMPADEVAKFRTASYSVHAAWSRDMNEKGINGRGLLYSAYKLLNKYSTHR